MADVLKPQTPADHAALEQLALTLTNVIAQGMAHLSNLALVSPQHAARIAAKVRAHLDALPPTEN